MEECVSGGSSHLYQAFSSQSSQPWLKLSHQKDDTHPYLGTRFLKDAMWKRDKKDFACEMGKLKMLRKQVSSETDHSSQGTLSDTVDTVVESEQRQGTHFVRSY